MEGSDVISILLSQTYIFLIYTKLEYSIVEIKLAGSGVSQKCQFFSAYLCKVGQITRTL